MADDYNVLGIGTPRQRAEAQRLAQQARPYINQLVPADPVQGGIDVYQAFTPGNSPTQQTARSNVLNKVAGATTNPMMGGVTRTKPFKSWDMTSTFKEPPVPQGMVRLYRGETPKFKSTGPDTSKGRWFTPSREVAEHFGASSSEAHGSGSRVSFIDVPAADVAKYGSHPEIGDFEGRNEQAVILPHNIADSRKTLFDVSKSKMMSDTKWNKLLEEAKRSAALDPYHAEAVRRGLIKE